MSSPGGLPSDSRAKNSTEEMPDASEAVALTTMGKVEPEIAPRDTEGALWSEAQVARTLTPKVWQRSWSRWPSVTQSVAVGAPEATYTCVARQLPRKVAPSP